VSISLRVSELVVVGWCVVAAAVALARPLDARARLRLVRGATALAVSAALCGLLPIDGAARAIRHLVPALFVLAAYWVSAAFFVAPQPALERRLLAIDHWAVARFTVISRRQPDTLWVLEVLEIAYLAVYAMLPLGAWTAWSHGGTPAVDRYWTLVFLAEASCYLALAWVQTRPPRVLETSAGDVSVVGDARSLSLLRRANEAVLTHGSIQVNTLPSGHAAGAVAAALALAWVGAPHAPLFAVVAGVICVATVVGRYHFLVDTVSGASVAVLWWWLLRAWWR
jgi:membrane-associated phospholipid phosphatase